MLLLLKISHNGVETSVLGHLISILILLGSEFLNYHTVYYFSKETGNIQILKNIIMVLQFHKFTYFYFQNGLFRCIKMNSNI